MASCGAEFMAMMRAANRPQAIVIVDRAVGGKLDGPVVVRDHINLTGSNPLLGPNHPSGTRFPVVQGIYIEDCLSALPHVVAAGLKPGAVPTAEELALIEKYGGGACCYNVVPAMLVAAHACCRVLALLLPEGASLPDNLLKEIHSMIGAVA